MNLPPAAATRQLLQQAFACHQKGQVRAAQALYLQVLAIDRDHFDALQLLGLCCLQAGELQRARDYLDRALALRQDVASVFNHRGIVLRRLGAREQAVADFTQVVARDPRSADAFYNRANTLRELGRLADALADYRKAADLAPARTDVLNNLGGCLAELGRNEEALACYSRLAGLQPQLGDAHANRGLVLQKLGRFDEALAAAETALAREPAHAEAWNLLGNLRMKQRRAAEALACYDRAVSLKPGDADAQANRGTALRELGRAEEAERSFEQALALKPGSREARLGLAKLAVEAGRFAEAGERFTDVLRSDAGDVDSLCGLAEVRKVPAGDPLFARLAARLTESDLDDEQRARLHHALGKIADDAGETDAAMENFMRSKSLRPATFDLARHRAGHQALRHVFTAEFLAERRGFGVADARPVFVVGMPRSGTTLTEQILASHGRVDGLGELQDLPRLATRLGGGLENPEGFAAALAAMTAEQSRELAARYAEAYRGCDPRALRLVDKRPHNFELLGLVALLFPQARIIHCRRNAMDNCLSMYMQYFSEGHGYNRDLATLGHYYRAHEELMAHWASVLPLPVHDCIYEETVADFEPAARALVAFTGLDWDPACLLYHAQERSVRTPSRWQVRQPVYKSSVERWRRYEAHLGPLKAALGA